MTERQTQEKNGGISLVEVFKLLLGKIKYLIAALLLGCVVGSVLSLFKTVNVRYYGTRVEFYVNPKKTEDLAEEEDGKYNVYGAYGRAAMENLIALLSSESFIEKMILNGEVLPQKDAWVNVDNPAEVALDVNGKIDNARAKLDELSGNKAQLKALLAERESKSALLAKKKTVLEQRWSALSYANMPGAEEPVVKNTGFNEYEYTVKIGGVTKESNPELYVLVQDTQTAYGEWDAIRKEIEGKDVEIASKREEITEKEAEKDAVVEVALEAWRQTELYQTTMEDYLPALRFSYMETSSSTSSTVQSFIHVDISVLNDKAFANEIFERVKTVVPEFVRNKMAVPSNGEYIGTYCERITRMDGIGRTNPDYVKDTLIKYGLLAGVLALLLACGVVLIVDRVQSQRTGQGKAAEQDTSSEKEE